MTDKQFIENARKVMRQCGYRRDMGGIGVCALNVSPCGKVLYKGECEAVAEWMRQGGCDSEDEHEPQKHIQGAV